MTESSWNLAEQLHEYRALSWPDGRVVTARMLVPRPEGDVDANVSTT